MISKDLVAASSRPLVLSILCEGDNYGYAIIQRVREISKEQLEWTDGMLYPVLHKLEREGLIESEWRKSEAGRERKYYRICKTGKKELSAERKQWMAVHNTLSELWKTKPALI